MRDAGCVARFNEAPAISPGNSSTPRRLFFARPESFNEAPAISPGNSAPRGRPARRASPRFNEAPAISPGNSELRKSIEALISTLLQ